MTNDTNNLDIFENKTQEQSKYSLNDELVLDGKTLKVVELLENKVHVKNKNEPFDSFWFEG